MPPKNLEYCRALTAIAFLNALLLRKNEET
jgi:hypothetical protein